MRSRNPLIVVALERQGKFVPVDDERQDARPFDDGETPRSESYCQGERLE